jgi:hypothetical protein
MDASGECIDDFTRYVEHKYLEELKSSNSLRPLYKNLNDFKEYLSCFSSDSNYSGKYDLDVTSVCSDGVEKIIFYENK